MNAFGSSLSTYVGYQMEYQEVLLKVQGFFQGEGEHTKLAPAGAGGGYLFMLYCLAAIRREPFVLVTPLAFVAVLWSWSYLPLSHGLRSKASG